MASPDHPPGLPFWIHQVVEYLLGALLISQGIQTDRPLVPVLLGVALVLMAATADGPAAAFRVVPRALHRWLDVVAVVAIVVLAVLGRDALGTTGLVFAVIAAVAMAALLLRTNYRTKTRGRATTPVSPSAPVVEPAGEVQPPSKSERIGRAAGRALGKGIRAYQDPPQDPP